MFMTDEELTGYSKQIDENDFTEEDIERGDRLKKLCGII